MDGIPGILVARVLSGAHVITVTGSLDPPVVPGSTPQPVTSEAPTAVHTATSAVATEWKGRGEEELRHPVMSLHNSASWVTAE
jgi:hypothetical protein